MVLDYKQLPNDSLGYWLVVDRSAQNDFSIDRMEYIEPDSISPDSLAFYSNLYWDNDLSGKDNFSFAKIQELFASVRVVELPTCTNYQQGQVNIQVIKGVGPYQYEWLKQDGTMDPKMGSFENEIELENLSAGTYELKLQDKNGVSFNRLFELNLENDIPVNLGPDQEIKEGEEIVINASKAIPDSLDVEYFWEGSFGFTANTKEIVITEPGLYRAFITNKKNGCVFQDEIEISGSVIKNIGVYPNPIPKSQIFKISISLKSEQKIEMSIVDLKGNIHQSFSSEGQSEYLFDVRLSEAGQYLIVVDSEGEKEAKKVIVY